MSRRSIQVFNMSFLDMITNFTGACILLLLLAMREVRNTPCPEIPYQTNAHYDPDKQIMWDTLDQTLVQLKPGDKILVTVGDYQQIPVERSANCPPCPGMRKCPECKDCPPPCPTPGECDFNIYAEASDCDSKGTADRSDDTYTVSLNVVSSGACGQTWKEAGGRTGVYGVAQIFGPYRVSEGKRSFTVSDGLRSTVQKTKEVLPRKCTEESAPGERWTSPILQGYVNFHIEWPDEKARVNIYVEKDGQWVYGGHHKEDGIGAWYQARERGLGGKILNIEEVYQSRKMVPGTYKIYAHFKGMAKNAGAKTSIKTRLIAFSKDKRETSRQMDIEVPYSEKNPRSGGGKLLATIKVAPDGSISIIR